MRFFMKVHDDDHVRQHFRVAFQHAKGIPFEDEDLMHDALAVMIRSGKTDELNALKSFVDRNSGGTLKRASAPEHILGTVTAAMDMIRSAQRNGDGKASRA